MFKPWMLAAMEDEGYMDTSDGLINRVAKYLAKSHNDTTDTAEFRSACIAGNVDPDSFTKSDLDKLQKKLRDLSLKEKKVGLQLRKPSFTHLSIVISLKIMTIFVIDLMS